MSLTIGWEGMSYKVSSRDYLCRARERLASANSEALFYATFELRAGVEARMSEYVEVQRHVSKKLKRGSQIAVLGKGIDRAFKLGDKLARFSYREGVGGDEVFVLYYTPVSKALQRNAQQLGDYLHHQKRFRPDGDEWWVIFRRKLETTLELLHRSCTGTMLGPPLMGSTKEVQTFVEVVEGCPVDLTEHLQTGRNFVGDISYPHKFPAQFEDNAYIWKPEIDFK